MTNKMTHTVIGLFDSRNEAEAASQDLVKNGFGLESLDVSNRKMGEQTTMDKPTNTSNESVGDSISNFFSSMFGNDTPEAQNYSNVAGQTEAILTVQTDSAAKATKAAEILDRNGAVDVDERAGQSQQNFAQTGQKQQNFAQKGQVTSDRTIPVMEEELQIGKRTVETGGARIRSRIIEKPVEETIRLREEHVTVNRQPVNRAVTDADMANFKEGDIEITERAEQAVVSKQARVTEEISIGKNVEEREKVINDKVRSTEVDVEQINQNVNTKKANN